MFGMPEYTLTESLECIAEMDEEANMHYDGDGETHTLWVWVGKKTMPLSYRFDGDRWVIKLGQVEQRALYLAEGISDIKLTVLLAV